VAKVYLRLIPETRLIMQVLIAWLFPRQILRYVYRWTQSFCLVCGHINLQDSPRRCEESYLQQPEAQRLAAAGSLKPGAAILFGIEPH
jgi:hypothetical protein